MRGRDLSAGWEEVDHPGAGWGRKTAWYRSETTGQSDDIRPHDDYQYFTDYDTAARVEDCTSLTESTVVGDGYDYCHWEVTVGLGDSNRRAFPVVTPQYPVEPDVSDYLRQHFTTKVTLLQDTLLSTDDARVLQTRVEAVEI